MHISNHLDGSVDDQIHQIIFLQQAEGSQSVIPRRNHIIYYHIHIIHHEIS